MVDLHKLGRIYLGGIKGLPLGGKTKEKEKSRKKGKRTQGKKGREVPSTRDFITDFTHSQREYPSVGKETTAHPTTRLIPQERKVKKGGRGKHSHL